MSASVYDPLGPERAEQRYWQSVAKEVDDLESCLFQLDEQLAVLEQECGTPRPRKKRLAPVHRRNHSKEALQGLAQSTAQAATGAVVQSRSQRQLRLQLKALRRQRLEPAGKRSLKMLHVSPRYGKINAKVLGIQRARNMKQKIAEGRYFHTMGMFKQDKYRKAMQTPPETRGSDEALQRWTLVAWDRRRGPPGGQAATYQGPDGELPVLRMSLWCTERSAEGLFSWCWWFGQRGQVGQEDAWVAETPYPVFIPSKGRAKEAHLNWRAVHCFGDEAFDAETPAEADSPGALVVVVVEPAEAQAYRDAWPDMPLIVLPESEMGPAFARWSVQKLCTSFRAEIEGGYGPLQHMQYCWLIDDSITSFYSLEKLSEKALEEEQQRIQSQLQQVGAIVATTPLRRPLGRRTERCGEGAMFAKALLAVQKASHWAKGNYAISGFLRDDGTAPMKAAQWALDSTSVFKVVMLNLVQLFQLQVEYVPQLRLFEDVCLNVQARNSGAHILKCMTYCYRADNKRFGGCAAERAANTASSFCTSLEDLISAEAFLALSPAAKAAVQHVYNWVHRDEDRSRARLEELGLPAPLAADVSNLPLEDVDQVYPEEVARIEDASEPATQSVAQLAPVQWDVQLKPQTIELDLD
ncbi:Uncharacterized protein SCF082_LOCUS18307 [Durusdinium trenchii]|uniref:TET-Associated Glycosyltransferase domain-containing protein n=1 Tax=Durusdinium trenchii TaxID=1381693 RepID=A0ABP0KN92_9DINO